MTETIHKKQQAAARFARVKFLDEEKREIEGWASAPSTDRQGDIVEPLGAKFQLPLPLLIDHDHHQAVGEVFEATPTPKGIRFRARIMKIAEPGAAKDLVDYAWALVRSGLRKTVSIGFRGIDVDVLPTGGYHWKSWDWYELSLVAVPAQPDAKVTGFKNVEPADRVEKRVAVIERPIVLDEKAAKAAELAGVRGHLHDLAKLHKKLVTKKWQVVGAHRDAIDLKLKQVGEEQARLVGREIELDSGIEFQTTPPPAPPKSARQWEVKDLAEPEFPWGARKAGDRDRIDKAFEANLEFFQDRLFKIFRDAGEQPDALVHLDDLVTVRAVDMAGQDWASKRLRELEERVAELEGNQQRFCGVHQRSLPYKKGNMVVHASSLWVALADVPEGIAPGTTDLWQMAVKQGDIR
jgi:HK97 family phage prohead protease